MMTIKKGELVTNSVTVEAHAMDGIRHKVPKNSTILVTRVWQNKCAVTPSVITFWWNELNLRMSWRMFRYAFELV